MSPMNFSRLNTSITILKKGTTKNKYNEIKEEYSIIGTKKAQVITTKPSFKETTDSKNENVIQLRMRYTTDFNESHFVLLKTDVYRIDHINNVNYENKELIVTCTYLKNSVDNDDPVGG